MLKQPVFLCNHCNGWKTCQRAKYRPSVAGHHQFCPGWCNDADVAFGVCPEQSCYPCISVDQWFPEEELNKRKNYLGLP